MRRHAALMLRQRMIFIPVLLACATFVVFSSVLNNDFVGWDDDSYIIGNPLITPLSMHNVARMFTGFFFSSWTPLSLLSHAVDYALWGLDPRGHHLTNIVVHVINTVWVYLIGVQIIVYARMWRKQELSPWQGEALAEATTAEIGGALIAALLFSWHPLRVESVACASSRKELLCALFAFPSAYSYVAYRLRRGPRWLYWCSLGLFTVALLAKPAVITWPLLLVSFDLLESGRRCERPAWGGVMLRVAPFAAVAGGVALATYFASRESGAVNLFGAPANPLLPAYTFWFYIEKILWPLGMSAVYEIPSGAALVAGSVAGMLTVLIALTLGWRGSPALLAALTVFAVTLLPVMGIVPTTIQAIANRYTYLAGPAPAIFLGYLFAGSWQAVGGRATLRRGFLTGGGVIVSGVLVLLSRHDIGLWRDAETMWRNAAALSPNHPVVHLDLGLTLLDNGAYGESIEQIRQAIALKPDYAEAYGGLGAACTASGDTAGAEAAFEQSLNLAPDNYLALSRYGYLRIAEHRYGEAAVLLQKALRRAPGDAFSTLCMADLWEKMGDAQKALHFARAAIAIRPTYGEAYYLAALIILKGSPQDPAGIGYLRTAARLGFAPAIRKLEALFNR